MFLLYGVASDDDIFSASGCEGDGMSQLTAGSLFSGVGMFDLAFALAGFDIKFQVEIDDFCQKVLRKHASTYWPNAQIHADVCRVGRHNLSPVDVLFGGFPCTDISVAGKGEGIQVGTRSGLWFEFKRIIGEIRPSVVLLENVAAITRKDGHIVISDLAEMGYDAKWGVISAADAGAPHLRERWFCVAISHTAHTGIDWRQRKQGNDDQSGSGGSADCRVRSDDGDALEYAARNGTEQQCDSTLSTGKRQSDWGLNAVGVEHANRERLETDNIAACSRDSRLNPWGLVPFRAAPGRDEDQPGVGRSLDGTAARMDGHRLMAHTFPVGPNMAQPETEAPRMAPRNKNTNNRLKALGNGGLPQIVYPIALEIRKLLEGSL
jgi:DNA-cytosine methyltransferase